MNNKEIKKILKQAKNLAKDKKEKELFEILGQILNENEKLKKEIHLLKCTTWVISDEKMINLAFLKEPK